MPSQPLVSVIIATYNREQYIRRAIKSVLGQSYKNIELIIIDDGSTDGTRNIIRPYLVDSRVHYIYQENKGISQARNNGTRGSKGKYIAVLDSDDFWCDDKKLEKQVSFLENNKDYVLVGGGIIKIDKNGKEIMRQLRPETNEKVRKSILLSPIFVHSTIVFRKKSWEQVGRYDENLDNAEDWDLWLKLGKIGKFYNFQDYFAHYLQWEENMSNYNILRNLKIANKLRKKYREDYPGFGKALFFSWFDYLYYFSPFKRQFHSSLSKIIKIIFRY